MAVQYEYMEPSSIEKRSFDMITDLLTDRGTMLNPEHEPIIKRCIHTSADFDYAENLYFSNNAVAQLSQALSAGACIVTDTQMAMAGINKRAARELGLEVFCFMADEDVAQEAQKRGLTRALVAVEKALRLQRGVIFAIGNAPTALLRLYEAIQSTNYRPAGIIAVPVGFVNVVESKELIMTTDVPCIVAKGRKGGSTIAAAICNALLYSQLGRL